MGKTILISSHILLELADLCDKVGIIEQGELRFVGTTDELLERTRGERVLHVAVADRMQAALELLKAMPGVSAAELHNSHIRLALEADQTGPAAIAQRLVEQGYALTRLEEERANLETAFMRLTKGLVQ